MTRHRGWIYLLCFCCLSEFAQDNSSTGQSKAPLPVPTGTANHLITLDVVVADRTGQTLPGLQQQDFTLLDNKQPQKITAFHAVAGPDS
jgi:hypothetical protein